MAYRNRAEAGRMLADKLSGYAGRSDVLVLGLPRGGLPVAFEVAQALHAPLDVFTVRKLGLPGQEELAMGAIATGGIRVLNDEVVRGLEIGREAIDAVAAREQRELERRERQYRGDRPHADPRGCVVILIDDGVATGSTMRAAIVALRRQNPTRIVVAIPVGPPETCDELREEADEVVCLKRPESFYAVGMWYRDFSQVSDDEVRDILDRAAAEPAPHAGSTSDH